MWSIFEKVPCGAEKKQKDGSCFQVHSLSWCLSIDYLVFCRLLESSKFFMGIFNFLFKSLLKESFLGLISSAFSALDSWTLAWHLAMDICILLHQSLDKRSMMTGAIQPFGHQSMPVQASSPLLPLVYSGVILHLRFKSSGISATASPKDTQADVRCQSD
ncbi:hypothetical protein STEG23_034120 [Scotinomys teguina]